MSEVDLVREVREKHQKTQMNTDPMGIHYSTYGQDYVGCVECEGEWPCWTTATRIGLRRVSSAAPGPGGGDKGE